MAITPATVAPEEKKIEKITFNCPLEIYVKIENGLKTGKFGSKTDAVLTALRAYDFNKI
jgi:Arc/MetJ-type ribon-helix-helix transcriptional regulator